jgi:hypothetical protein
LPINVHPSDSVLTKVESVVKNVSIADRINIHNNRSLITFQTAWINGGIMKNIYVNNLNKVESVLVVRFKPYAFYDIFNLPTRFFRNKDVASLADIHFDPFVCIKPNLC